MSYSSDSKLEVLYQKIADITSGICGRQIDECSAYKNNKYRCCEMKYCEQARDFAKSRYGIDLQPTGNPDLLYMSGKGCVVPPYLRPICSLHCCTISYAPKSHIDNDIDKTKQYFDLRKEILDQSKLENKLPEGF